MRLAKLVIRAGMNADQHTGQIVERLAQALLYTTDDKREGAAAFLDKRTPSFQGAVSTVDTGIENVHEVLVVGAGAMGSQIAMVCALAGYRATATDLTKDALNHAQTQLRQRVGRTVEKGRLTRDDAAAAFDRLTLTTGLDAARADFVIEAASREARRQAGGLRAARRRGARAHHPHHQLLHHRVLQLAGATTRPDRVANMHFFNPAL